MDVGELRVAFLQSGELIERVKIFRSDRIADIKTGETPFPLVQNKAFIAIHIIPMSAFSTSFRISSATIAMLQSGHSNLFKPPYMPNGWSHRINLDGIVAYSTVNDPITGKYTQLYRDGKIEAVETSILHWNAEEVNPMTRRMMPMYSIEAETMAYVKQSLELLTTLEFQAPFYVFISLVGTDGLTVSPPTGHIAFHYENIVQKELLLPEVVIENMTDNL